MLIIPARVRLLALICLVAALGTVLAVWPTPAAAQTSEAEVSIALAILAYDGKKYDEAQIGRASCRERV